MTERPHSQGLKAAGTELEQVLPGQLPVLKAVILQGVIEAWREDRTSMASQATSSLPQSPFLSHLFLTTILGPRLGSAHFTDETTE